MKTKTENLSTELKANSQRLGQEIIVAEENLKKELRNTSELFNITVKSLVKTNAELSNAKRDLTTKLEGTKQELEKTKIDLEKTKVNVNYLSVKLNATEKEWTEMKIRAGNLSIEIKSKTDVKNSSKFATIRSRNKSSRRQFEKRAQSKFKSFGNCNNQLDLNENGIEQHEIHYCRFDCKVK
nr:unnamed protein product [Daphnia galeata]